MNRPSQRKPRTLHRWLATAVLLGILGAGVAWAGAETEKIKRLHERGKLDKAWESCEALEAAAGSELTYARDTCAQVHADRLALAHPSGLGRDQLDAHAQRWPGTPAGRQSLELAARILLGEAGQDLDQLNQVTWTYQRTDAAADARTRIWTLALDQAKAVGTAAAYADYRHTYPDSPLRDQAWALEQQAAFDHATTVATAEAMRVFAAAYPDSPNAAEALVLEMDHAFDEADTAGTSEAWHTLYKRYVTHPRRHQIQARWAAAAQAEVDTLGVGPLLRYTSIHTSDTDARAALQVAIAQGISVRLVPGHPDHPGWTLPREGEGQAPAVSQLSQAVQVRFPYVSNHAPEIRILADDGTDERSLQSHLQATFKLVLDETAPLATRWRSPEEGLWETRLPLGLCQPRGVRFLVEVQLMGETVRFPFRSDTACADWWVPIAVWSGSARRGGSKSMGAWSGAAGELPPLPWKDVWWTGARFEHGAPSGSGTVVTWPDGTRYWAPIAPGLAGRNVDELLVLASFPAPGFWLQEEGTANVLHQPGNKTVAVAAGLSLSRHVWLAATRPPGQGQASAPLGPETGWIVAEASGAWQPMPPEGATLLALRYPTPEIQETWAAQLLAMTGEAPTLRWSAMADLDQDDQLEGIVCLTPGEGDRCFVADWRDGGPAWFPIEGFDWPASRSTAPLVFWSEQGVHLAQVEADGALTARYTGTAYVGGRQGL